MRRNLEARLFALPANLLLLAAAAAAAAAGAANTINSCRQRVRSNVELTV